MPKEVRKLEETSSSTRGKLLQFLKKNSHLAYTLRELHEIFLDKDAKLENKYSDSPRVLYHLIYGYLREFRLKNNIVKKGNYYYYKK